MRVNIVNRLYFLPKFKGLMIHSRKPRVFEILMLIKINISHLNFKFVNDSSFVAFMINIGRLKIKRLNEQIL